MVVKVYISGISGNKEVKKRQQRVLMILDSKSIKYELIDITEPGKETDKEFMQNNAKSNGGTVSDPNPRSPLPPQMFNEEEYCGDYDQFDLANEVDTLEQFLKVEVPPEPTQGENETALNGDVNGEKSKETSQEKETTEAVMTDKDMDAGDEVTPAKEGSPAKEASPAKEGSPAKEESPIKEGSPDKEESPAKEGSPAKEETLLREDSVVSKEATPTRDENQESPKPESPKETSPAKEISPERQKSIEKDATEMADSTVEESEVNSKKASKENTPEVEASVNENGHVSSREQSEEKGATDDHTDSVEIKKDNPSELLIESEQAVAAE